MGTHPEPAPTWTLLPLPASMLFQADLCFRTELFASVLDWIPSLNDAILFYICAVVPGAECRHMRHMLLYSPGHSHVTLLNCVAVVFYLPTVCLLIRLPHNSCACTLYQKG